MCYGYLKGSSDQYWDCRERLAAESGELVFQFAVPFAEIFGLILVAWGWAWVLEETYARWNGTFVNYRQPPTSGEHLEAGDRGNGLIEDVHSIYNYLFCLGGWIMAVIIFTIRASTGSLLEYPVTGFYLAGAMAWGAVFFWYGSACWGRFHETSRGGWSAKQEFVVRMILMGSAPILLVAFLINFALVEAGYLEALTDWWLWGLGVAIATPAVCLVVNAISKTYLKVVGLQAIQQSCWGVPQILSGKHW